MYHSAKFYTLQKILLKGGWGGEDGHTQHTHNREVHKEKPSTFQFPCDIGGNDTATKPVKLSPHPYS